MRTATQAINAYNKTGLETAIPSADPHKLILMLFEGATLAVGDAKRHMQRSDIGAKGASISKAIAIIDGGLKASLDIKAGGDLAEKLSMLYQYMNDRLLHAGVKNDVGALDEVTRLLGELSGAWAAIGKQQPVATPAPLPGPTPTQSRGALTYGKA